MCRGGPLPGDQFGHRSIDQRMPNLYSPAHQAQRKDVEVWGEPDTPNSSSEQLSSPQTARLAQLSADCSSSLGPASLEVTVTGMPPVA